MKTIAIFQKEIKKDKINFISYSCKNKKGEYCKVKFLDDAKDFVSDNITDNKPFNVVVEENKISYKERTKEIEVKKNGVTVKETITERTFFIDDIYSIEPYEREAISDDII